jgi:HAD superfamily hydrolase (TIGR01490 family)
MTTASPYGSFDSPDSFIAAVLSVNPKIAAFDCDGTLWAGDSGVKFFDWEIENGLIATEVAQAAMARYDEYLAGRVSEDEICAYMVQIHRGLKLSVIESAVQRFVAEHVLPDLFPEIASLVAKLKQRGCDVWAVSSTNSWVVEAAVRTIGIPAERVLAVRAEVENGIVTDRVGEITSGAGKAVALKRELKAPLDASFGNSVFDLEMLELAGRPFPVNPTADLKRIAQQRGWPTYQPILRKVTSPTG